ncbi:MAG: LysM peptidoglycan-binding domain-containing protein [Myxococcales bacterium]|jgi:hypothetical protein
MKRAIIAALAAVLIPGSVVAQEAEAEQVDGPEVVEPESSSVEVAAPAPVSPTQQGVDQVAETYTVRPGDTLWDLSQRFLGNPWYWPKVWSYNPEIENPHWIYPGNIVRFYPPASEEMPIEIAAGAEEPEELPMPTEVADLTAGSIHKVDLLGQEEDIVALAEGRRIGYVPEKKGVLRQDGLVTVRELDEAGVIDRAWAEKQMLSTYDKVYLRFRNRSAVRLGERYSIFRTGGKVIHPVTGEHYGYLTHVVGSLRVTGIDQQVVTGIIESTIEDIHRGDFIGPLGNFERQIITKPNMREVQGIILASLIPNIPMFGEHHVVFIDKGSRDGVEEGNTFSVVRQGDPLYHTAREDEARDYPEETVAQIVVFDVKENASAGLIIRSFRELVIGDKVVTKVAASQASLVP